MARIVLIPKNMKAVSNMTRHRAEAWTSTARWLRTQRPPTLPAAEMRRIDAEMSRLGEQLRQLAIEQTEAARELTARAELAARFYGGLRRQNLPVPNSAFWRPRKFKVPLFDGTLRVGDTGPLVRQLQRRLRAAGLDPGPLDGVYGQRTRSAVLVMQKRLGLSSSGMIDAVTAAALGLLGRPELRGGDPRSNRQLGRQMMLEAGWGPDQWPALDALWTRESNWRQLADNPSSDAYGIPQSLPGSKMASAGADWRTNPRTQIKWGLGYIRGRYGSPKNAWAHSERVGWY